MYLGTVLSLLNKRRTALTRLWQVLLDRVSEVVHAHRLQPHPARSGEGGQEEARPAAEGVLDAGDGRDVETHRLLVHADVAWMDAQRIAGLQVVHDHLSGQLNPSPALS